jgi:hypothetical protein
MQPGPNTNRQAFEADLKATLDRIMTQKKPLGDVEAAVREICARHDVTAGPTLKVGQLTEPLYSLLTHGAALASVFVGQEEGGRQFLSDRRWLVFIDDKQVAELRAAGAHFVDHAIPSFEPLSGTPQPFETHPDPRTMLQTFGIGGRGISNTHDGFTNNVSIDIDGANFAADVLFVLAVAGAVAIVVDQTKRMVEGRSVTGRTVGYAMGTRPLLN